MKKRTFYSYLHTIVSIILYACISAVFMVSAAFSALPDKSVAPDFLGPCDLLFIASDTLCVLERDARQLETFSYPDLKKLHSLTLPDTPNRMIFTGSHLVISCGELNGQVIEIDPKIHAITRSWTGIHTPWALAYAPNANRLYVSRRFMADIMMLDLSLPPGESIKSASIFHVVREPLDIMLSRDQKRLFAANFLPLLPSNSSTVSSCISVIDLSTGKVVNRPLPDGTTNLRGLSQTPDGRYVFMVHAAANHRSLTSQLAGGWTSRSGITILDTHSEDQMFYYLLDDFNKGAPNPVSSAVTADGSHLVIALAGCHELAFIPLDEFIKKIHRDTPLKQVYVTVYGIGSMQDTMYRVKISGLNGPRSLAVHGMNVITAGYFSDNLAIFSNINKLQPRVVPLGPKPKMNDVRRGEMYFHDAELSLETWHSCATCHPDARHDGLNWDLLNDGLGNHKNTKSMLYTHATPPAMITGVRENAQAAVRAGFIHIHFMPQPETVYQDVDAYLKALRPIPSPRLNSDGTLSVSARRGKRLFTGSKTGCSSCHSGKYYTDLRLHNVLSENESDRGELFDTPSLVETFRSAPFLHDGRYTTLEQLLYEGHHGDPEKKLDRLSPQEKADLVEFILSL